jgi:hypothetical protein
MAQLYREVVLKEKPATSNEGGFIPLGAILGAKQGSNGATNPIAPAHGNGSSSLNLKKTSEEVGEPVAGD